MSCIPTYAFAPNLKNKFNIDFICSTGRKFRKLPFRKIHKLEKDQSAFLGENNWHLKVAVISLVAIGCLYGMRHLWIRGKKISQERNISEFTSAIVSKDTASVKQMLDKNPNFIHEQIGPNKSTPLHIALARSEEGNRTPSALIQLLLERGADLNARDALGLAPLDVAVLLWQGLLINPILNLLVAHGADRYLVDSKNKTIEDYEREIASSKGLSSSIPQFICPITKKVIRDPVMSPRNKVIFERAALERLQQVTQFFLDHFPPYVELPNVKAFIEARLRETRDRDRVILEKFQQVSKADEEDGPINSLGASLKLAATLTDPASRKQVFTTLIEKNADLYIEDQRGKTLKSYPSCSKEIPENYVIPYEIPEEFEERNDFPQFICPISRSLIIHPVLDPTNGITLYEKTQILRYLRENPISPITSIPLEASELIEVPNITNYIKKRLCEHREDSEGVSFVQRGFLKQPH